MDKSSHQLDLGVKERTAGVKIGQLLCQDMPEDDGGFNVKRFSIAMFPEGICHMEVS